MENSKLKRELKREQGQTDDRPDDRLHAEDLSDAEVSPSGKLEKKSPHKKKKQKNDESDEDSYGSEDSDMDEFIVDDEEAEQEQREAREREHRTHKREKKKKKSNNYKIDDDDVDLINENTGIGMKRKNRLKKNAEIEAERNAAQGEGSFVKQEVEVKTKKDEEQMQIDTVKVNHRQDRKERPDHRPERLEKQRLAVEIFGDSDEEDQSFNIKRAEANNVVDQQMDEIFNADDIDDPFSTQADKQIAELDIPERLQVKLKDRLKPDDKELQEEAEWVLDRLTTYSTISSGERAEQEAFKYSRLLRQKDAKNRILKVLSLIRKKCYDVPMVAKYRKYEYAEELDEDAIWIIFSLDQEFGKFQRHKKQIKDFLHKITQINPLMKGYEDELAYAKDHSQLISFNSLISYLRSYYSDKLNSGDSQSKKKQPQRRDEIQIAKSSNIEKFASHFFLTWAQFIENLEFKKMTHIPPKPLESPLQFATKYMNEQYPDAHSVHKGVCKFAAIELSAQPVIRNQMKNTLNENGYLSTKITEQGRKDLDLFHQSYRVKLVQKMPLSQLRYQNDLFLDVLQCEKAGLVTVEISMDERKLTNFKDFLKSLYMQNPESNADQYNVLRRETINMLVDQLLMKEIIKELRDEIKEEAESFVIARCKESYKELLMTGPFTTKGLGIQSDIQNEQEEQTGKRVKRQEQELIKDRDRICVMGAIMHQIDANNYVVTIAVVDKYGELVAHRDLMRLLPPRKRKDQQNQDGQGENRPQPKSEEELQHEKDKAKLVEELEKHSVDLIVVAANSLEARNLKMILNSICEKQKNKQLSQDDPRKGNDVQKEAFVIWGGTEIPKLFALSHNSQKMHKNTQQMLKQAISLARFEQDPLCEALNLWSPITAENQTLAMNLDPMQKLVNQARLADGLEEVNIQVVNEVGIDLNLLIDHEHMHCMLQFVSGLGPRKAKRLISKFKGLGKKLTTRGEIFKTSLLTQEVYFSANGFLKIRIPKEDLQGLAAAYDVLDQTRIHHESYRTTYMIAKDACLKEGDNQDVNKHEKTRLLKEVIAQPSKLKHLDLKVYYSNLEASGQSSFSKIVDLIIQELQHPFADPREYRDLNKTNISNERLFYMLIEESPRTFKKGMIVTASVSRVLESKAVCRLDNGLPAIIYAANITEEGGKFKDVLDQGHTIQGRIEKISTDNEKDFEVTLNCKKNDLQSHETYKKDLAFSLGIAPEKIDRADLRNSNFSVDLRPKQVGRFIPRRIAHEKFKNISSRRAIAELSESENGDYLFRPSTRSENSITLTWKFWKKNFVHIDILEQQKQPGAAIGSRLIISNDYFDSLREIVERYIIPCNRLVREVIGHTKFSDADDFDDMEERLKEEKKEAPQRIPYRFAILPQYPQHIVLGYVPKEKVNKEFIKVRPKGFYFHDQNLVPFQMLINWFKDNWKTHEYQRHFKRQKSPRIQLKPVNLPKQDDGNESQGPEFNGGGNYGLKSERGHDSRKSPGGYNNNWSHVKQEGGQRSPKPWGDNGMEQQDQQMRGGDQNWGQANRGGGGGGGGRGNCFKCDQPGHMARDCPNNQGGGNRSRGCFKCGKEGHMARDCPDGDGSGFDRGPYKRQRRDEEGDNTNGNWGGSGGVWSQPAQQQSGGWDGV